MRKTLILHVDIPKQRLLGIHLNASMNGYKRMIIPALPSRHHWNKMRGDL